MSVPLAQLSCEQCQRRKTKCSKTTPCSACEKAGIQCTAVQRQRLPRGRSGKQRADITTRRALRDRVERLESLVKGLQQPQQHERDLHDNESRLPETAEAVSARTTSVDAFVAPGFWADLSGAVAGLKEVLEYPDIYDEDDRETDESSPNQAKSTPDDSDGALDAHRLLFASGSSAETTLDLPPALKGHLLSVYKDRVDCLFKPLHWPSTLLIILNQQNCQDNATKKESHALESAIYFTSACTLFDHELNGRRSIVEKLRRECEDALVTAGHITTTSFMLLQAFVVYFLGVRACQANAQQWTLTALAARLANAQGIPSNLAGGALSVEIDVQRRLWQCIGVLDLQSAFDRGSHPMALTTWNRCP
ncbi:hypothetical protein M409DRAFT_51243 [Zasmidium cellare ATCC 36951]|uniref:Zn(2)-C6 fungal-type domain-containing protein n=1 Tax=Zasmidium cellare ATCC 36951 TaxID=1080233 RepID=A0A6A6CXR0_ZASCE|nr:uncharacterized protein M409DRAFT_51243 [Zasmidium cellare ATCC 36951]KAF2171008.1 hypothetical protein M409DRAFT_51243 [Zasmidium cellare ATCC 36951]